MAVTLDNNQRKLLLQALLSAFPRYDDLEQMVSLGLGENLEAVAGTGALRNVTFKLMDWARAHGRLGDLIEAAREENPGNPDLIEFYRSVLPLIDRSRGDAQSSDVRALSERLRLDPVPMDSTDRALDKQGLEKIVLKSVQFGDVETWRARMAQCEAAVCRVEIPAWSGIGSGFLVGPDLLMTNYHVLEQLLEGQIPPQPIAFRFDYKTTPDGTKLRDGETFTLAANWRVADSAIADLDYALVRLATTAGQRPIGGAQGAPARGWLKPVARDLEAGAPVFVIQHPKAAPLKIASGPFVDVNGPGTRVRYKTNTDEGSSGSPCFDSDWDLIALHQGGDDVVNRGMPFGKILEDLRAKGRADLVGT